MALVLTEEQELLRQTARDFVREKSPVAELRRLRDSRDADGFSRSLWNEMAELGWAGVPFGEEFGGAGMGQTELGLLLEECGRSLTATPLVSTVLASGSAVSLGANGPARKEALTAIAAGQRIVAFALQESARFDPVAIATRAEAGSGVFRLRGAKRFVLDGHVADQFIVLARTAGDPGDPSGLALFLVDADAPGLSRQRTTMVDGRNAAVVRFEGVEVSAEAALGTPGDDAALLDGVLDRCAAGMAAEMLGGLDAAFSMTLQYLKDRKQFGVPIGSFQGLKHRAARMYVAIELTRSCVLEALQAIDAGHDDAARLACIAKAQASDAMQRVSSEGVQMFGGLGVTDEQDIGLYLKRGRVQQHSFGDAAYQRARYAALSGF